MPLAFVLHRYALPGRRACLALVTVPVRAADGRRRGGVSGRSCRRRWVGGVRAILLAHVFFNLAVVVRVVGGLWAHLDPRYEAGGALSGRLAVARVPHGDLAAAPAGRRGRIDPGLPLHVHLLRCRARARRPVDGDPRGRGLPTDRPAARPARRRGARDRAARAARRRAPRERAPAGPARGAAAHRAPTTRSCAPVRGRRWWLAGVGLRRGGAGRPAAARAGRRVAARRRALGSRLVARAVPRAGDDAGHRRQRRAPRLGRASPWRPW